MSMSMKSSFDKEAFINAIRQNEFIFNPTHPDYMNRDISEKTFTDLAEQFQLKDAAEAKTKWKSIKDSYRIQKKKIRDSARSGSGASGSKVRWPFFEQCGFLDRFMAISKICSNHSLDAIDSSDSDTPPPTSQLLTTENRPPQKQASMGGFQALLYASRLETRAMPNECPTVPLPELRPSKPLAIDQHSQYLLEQHDMGHIGTPMVATGDGNCFFNGASIATYGHENFSSLLRVRTCIQMCLNEETYLRRSDAADLISYLRITAMRALPLQLMVHIRRHGFG
ncbi:hypothetical protein LOTGIDRAFT_232796 [Lottia gigantea]|uniref:MADF domain-containing protein n=1 Tax=Lottia gigantea TaxID=225164 RepID=V4A8F7_LOTGI|nr:hypothetical protein LOTGIDRAFT_232796 [Lottia gigantea]ESO93012.1 hypothetical protein LOTGIDRAFT_232796 [Lottia gigantea]